MWLSSLASRNSDRSLRTSECRFGNLQTNLVTQIHLNHNPFADLGRSSMPQSEHHSVGTFTFVRFRITGLTSMVLQAVHVEISEDTSQVVDSSSISIRKSLMFRAN